MPERSLQRVEALTERSFPVVEEILPSQPTRRTAWRRFGVFWGVFLVSSAISLTYTFLRPAVYECTAILQIFPLGSGTSGESKEANDAAIQKHIASHASITAQAWERLGISPNPGGETSDDETPGGETSDDETPGGATSDDETPGGETPDEMTRDDETSDVLVPSMTATVLPDTNVLELRAEGSDAELLPRLVNTWVEVYLESHQTVEKAAAPTVNEALRKQLDELESRVTEKRRILSDFRGKHNIESMQREENHVLRQLQGLTEALNKAQEDERTAAARLKTLQQALSKGKFVGRKEDQEVIAGMQQQADQLETLIAQRKQILKPAAFARDEVAREAQRQLEVVRELINRKVAMGIQEVFDEAKIELSMARELADTTNKQLIEYKRQAAEFTTRFAEHEALVAELSQLEKLYRTRQEQLVHTEVIRDVLPPEVTVLQYGSTPQAPIRPFYRRDAAISVAGSLLFGLIAVLIDLLLTQPVVAAGVSERRTVIYRETEAPALPYSVPTEFVQQEPVSALPHAPVRELSPAEVRAMLDVSDDAGRALIGSLLSGLQVEEIQRLRWSDVDLENGAIRIVGGQERFLTLSDEVRELFKHYAWQRSETDTLVWCNSGREPFSAAALDALISSAAHVAGVPSAQDVAAETLRSTYVAFLARQGIRLDLLEQTVGRLSRRLQDSFQMLSPPGASEDLQEIERVYPALQATGHESAKG